MRVVVAGVNYGAMYLFAVGASQSFELGGIISRGSQRSAAVAEEFSVPLFVDIEELPEDIDLACVAVGSMEAGHGLAKRLLARGIPVLLEHPMPPDLLEDLISESKRLGVVLGLNCQPANLEPVRRFIDASHVLAERSHLLNAVVLTNPRLLYATLDVLGQVFTEFRGVELAPQLAATPPKHGHCAKKGVASVCTQLLIEQTPVSILCSRNLSETDDGTDQEFAPRVILTYQRGSLILAHVWGPVIWTRGTDVSEPPLPLGALVDGEGAEPGGKSAAGRESTDADRFDADVLWLASTKPPVIKDYGAMRVEANRIALERLREQILTGKARSNQTDDHLLAISRLWNDLRTQITTVPV